MRMKQICDITNSCISGNCGHPGFIFIIKEIKTSSGLYWVAQAFALLHVLRRQGEIYFSIPKRT